MGLKIFNLIFQLDNEKFKSLEWANRFLERHLLELRIHQLEITDEIRDKFLSFLESSKLEDNTESKLDRNYELGEFTSIEKAPYFYSQPFFLINYQSAKEGIEAFCWNNNIRSIIILEIPNEMKAHLENVRSLKVKEGKIKTKNIPITERGQKHARIIIRVHETSDLKFQRFKIQVDEL